MALAGILIGAGARGLRWIEELHSHPDWYLAAVVEPDQETIDRIRLNAHLGDTPCFPGIEEALNWGKQFDAAIIATPPDEHVTSAKALLGAGAALLVEKPFSTTLEDARSIVINADSAGLPVVVGQNYRYLRDNRKIREVIQSRRLGRIGSVTAHYYRVPHEITPSLARLPHRVLWGMAIHHLDTWRHVLDREVIGVSAASTTSSWNEPPVGATVRLLLDFEDGIVGTYSASYESSGHEFFERGQEFYHRIVGSAGTLHVLHRWLVLCPSGKLPRFIRRGPRLRTEERILLNQLRDAIREGTEPEVSGRDNLKTMAICEATIRSHESRAWVDPRKLLTGAN